MTWAPGDSVALTTQRFELRTLRSADVSPTFLAWMQDPEVVRYTHTRFDRFDEGSLRAWVAGHEGIECLLVGVFDREHGDLIGHLRAVVDAQQKRAELSALVGDRAWWGRGVILEARSAWMDFLFDDAGLERVWGQTFAANHAMLFNYQHQGFAQEGILRAHCLLEGQRADIVCFGMLRSAWHAQRAAADGTAGVSDA